jgi:hypothetical protein
LVVIADSELPQFLFHETGDAGAAGGPCEDGSDSFAPGAAGQAVNWRRHVCRRNLRRKVLP